MQSNSWRSRMHATGAGVDSAWEQKKLEPENSRESSKQAGVPTYNYRVSLTIADVWRLCSGCNLKFH